MGALFLNGWGQPALQAWTVVHFDGTNWPAITGGACLVSVSF